MRLSSKVLRLAFGLLGALSVAAVGEADQLRGYLETLRRHVTLSSTVADNGDLNPYAVVVAPLSVGKIQKDDILVDNFNNVANLQGTGTTITKVTPNGKVSLFFPGKAPLGLTAALGVVRVGFIFVGNMPTADGTPATDHAFHLASVRRRVDCRRFCCGVLFRRKGREKVCGAARLQD